MSILNFATLASGKNRVINFFTNSSQDVMESGGSLVS